MLSDTSDISLSLSVAKKTLSVTALSFNTPCDSLQETIYEYILDQFQKCFNFFSKML